MWGALIAGVLGLYLLSRWLEKRRQARVLRGRWDASREGWQDVEVQLDGVRVDFCVAASEVEGWVEVHRVRRLDAKMTIAPGTSLMELDEQGRVRVFRAYGEVRVRLQPVSTSTQQPR